MKTIGEKIKEIREEHGFPQKAVADHLGVHRSNYSKIENNIQNLTPTQIKLFCEFFKVSADYLLGIETNNSIVYHSTTKQEMNEKIQELLVLVNQDSKKTQ